MKCKWCNYEPFKVICFNGNCPARADVCPLLDPLYDLKNYQEICKYYESGNKQEREKIQKHIKSFFESEVEN